MKGQNEYFKDKGGVGWGKISRIVVMIIVYHTKDITCIALI